MKVWHKTYQQLKNIPKKIVRFSFRAFILSLDFFYFQVCRKKNTGAGIGFVRTDAIGDFVIWLREAALIRQAFSGEHLTLFCNVLTADLARQTGYWDEVVGLKLPEFGSLSARYRVLSQLSKYQFRVLYHPVSARVLLVGDSVVRAIGADEKVGVSLDFTNSGRVEIAISNTWYTSLIPRQDESEIDFNSYFTRKICVPNLQLNSDDIKTKFLSDVSLAPGGPYIVICLGASSLGKMWSVEHFSQVVDWIMHNTAFQVVFVGSEDERGLADSLINSTSGAPGRCSNRVGSFSLSQTFALINEAVAVVGNDSAVVHIAALLMVPAVCIAGGGHFGRFIPYPIGVFGPKTVFFRMPCYYCDWNCIDPNFVKGMSFPCVGSVIPENVILALQTAIGQKK